MPLQHFINHVSIVVDRSGSMSGHSKTVVQVFDRELEALKQRSIDLNQETRISIYLFDNSIECLTFDMDVMRFKSLAGYYSVRGSTALLDAVAKSIEDNRKLPELYGDHAFLQYVITDGMENASRLTTASSIRNRLENLPDNWTNAVLVPDKNGETFAENFGFNKGSIAIWDASRADAINKVGEQFTTAINNYMNLRASGVRGTKSFFALDSATLSSNAKKLTEIPPKDFEIFSVTHDAPIRDYIKSVTNRPYAIGSGHYQPTKKVYIQDYKNVYVQNVATGKVYAGNSLRTLLGLPSDSVDVIPGNHTDWRIFIQSTSVNRKLFAGTAVLVRN